MDRFGAIGFLQYRMPVAEDVELGLTGSASYMFTYAGDNDVTVTGIGPAVSVTYTGSDAFIPSMAVSYTYSKDNSHTDIDYQHLIKVPVNLGFRIGENAVVNGFGIWNYDASDYMSDNDNRSFYDAGVEVQYYASETFSMSLGYKAVLDVENYESNTIYLGTLIRF